MPTHPQTEPPCIVIAKDDPVTLCGRNRKGVLAAVLANTVERPLRGRYCSRCSRAWLTEMREWAKLC